MTEQATSYGQIIGQVIRGRRELKRISLQAMAESAALTASGWSRVENGDTTMTLAQLRKAARKLDVEPWTLIRQADLIAAQLGRRSVTVHDDKPRNMGKWLLGGAAILAVVADVATAISEEER
jgi:transcriptional regulator with XRE-family HTH domain